MITKEKDSKSKQTKFKFIFFFEYHLKFCQVCRFACFGNDDFLIKNKFSGLSEFHRFGEMLTAYKVLLINYLQI